ncbi:MAG TPA: CDP-alcohol phosphatidyltransferase family protein [Bryobacteraceae bacterium]|nr:CDP-alcohol phosphatidyltransferase family protein [Bryobacteraceae bacterium]
MKHVPNILSIARILAAPFLFVLLWRRQYERALIVMLLTGITDGLDGWIARRWSAQSRLGAILDPIADKLLLSGSFLVLALDRAIPAWLAWLVLGRDALILLFAAAVLLFTKTRREFPPTWWGKASTVCQICFVLAVLLHFIGFAPLWLVDLGIWLTAALTSVSFADYVRTAVR